MERKAGQGCKRRYEEKKPAFGMCNVQCFPGPRLTHEPEYILMTYGISYQILKIYIPTIILHIGASEFGL
jgi:hypothetical protein